MKELKILLCNLKLKIMDELKKKITMLADMVTAVSSKEDVIKLIQKLKQKYSISLDEIVYGLSNEKSVANTQNETSNNPPAQTGEEFEVEVLFENGKRSFYPLNGVNAIGIIIPGTNMVLWKDGSENRGSRDKANNFVRQNTPRGYLWRLMNFKEWEIILKNRTAINNTLKKLGNAVLIDKDSYLLLDNTLSAGYVRYVAAL